MTSEELMGRYLQRLGLTARPTPSWRALSDLVTAHLQTVPFENLDIVDGLRPDLTTAGVLHKVAIRRRGGFCYELNEAFGALLIHLGFSVKRIEARVWAEPQQKFGPPFDHLALIVNLAEGEFLTDVGFGDNNRTPMRLPEDALTDISGRYTLAQASDDVWLLSRSDRPLYEMTLEAQPLPVFVPMYRYHQTSPDSLFAKGLICTRPTASGRVTLSRDRLTIVDGARRTETVSPDRDQALEQYFGIVKEGLTC
jgi:N-hydroxyarylamine O-acetyltransferase